MAAHDIAPCNQIGPTITTEGCLETRCRGSVRPIARLAGISATTATPNCSGTCSSVPLSSAFALRFAQIRQAARCALFAAYSGRTNQTGRAMHVFSSDAALIADDECRVLTSAEHSRAFFRKNCIFVKSDEGAPQWPRQGVTRRIRVSQVTCHCRHTVLRLAQPLHALGFGRKRDRFDCERCC